MSSRSATRSSASTQIRHVVHDDSRRGHPQPGRGDLRGGPLLAGAADPDQPELQANDNRRRAGGRPHAAPTMRRDFSDRTDDGVARRRHAVALQAPGAGDRARVARRELRRHDRHRLGQVALLLHPDRQRRARANDAQAARARTRAIVIYPMNALANSQLEELDKFTLERTRRAARSPSPATRDRKTPEERRRIADNPPDILLTNFMMLELLMTRQDELDRQVIGNCAGLRFLVLDELHTYRGRQGADVALLCGACASGSRPSGCSASARRRRWRAKARSRTRAGSSRASRRSSSRSTSRRATSSSRRSSASPTRPQTRDIGR